MRYVTTRPPRATLEATGGTWRLRARVDAACAGDVDAAREMAIAAMEAAAAQERRPPRFPEYSDAAMDPALAGAREAQDLFAFLACGTDVGAHTSQDVFYAGHRRVQLHWGDYIKRTAGGEGYHGRREHARAFPTIRTLESTHARD